MTLFDMTLSVEEAGETGAGRPSIARIRDYWLGGRHHGEVDRRFADNTAVCAPHIPFLVREQRSLLVRMVRYLVENGVRQFLDLGSGLPTIRHVHEVAQKVDPGTRVVYVDCDPGVAADGRELLSGNDNAVLLEADIRRPEQVLDAPETRRLLDLREPVAVLVIATLQHIPDSDDPTCLIAAYRDAMCSGSYFAISHFGPDQHLADAYDLFDQMNFGQRPDVNLRDRISLATFFSGMELIDPGIVPLVLWRPDPDDEIGRDPARLPIHAGLGRKP